MNTLHTINIHLSTWLLGKAVHSQEYPAVSLSSYRNATINKLLSFG